MQDVSKENKLNLLINHIDALVYELISEVANYTEVMEFISNMYVKTPRPNFYTLCSDIL